MPSYLVHKDGICELKMLNQDISETHLVQSTRVVLAVGLHEVHQQFAFVIGQIRLLVQSLRYLMSGSFLGCHRDGCRHASLLLSFIAEYFQSQGIMDRLLHLETYL